MTLEKVCYTAEDLISFEHEMAQLYREGHVKGPSHFAEGNENQIIKIFRGLQNKEYVTQNTGLTRKEVLEKNLIVLSSATDYYSHILRGIRQNDYLFASYRNHAHALLKGMPRAELKDAIMKGKSMHPLSSKYRIITSAIVPGQLPMAVGRAMALQRSGGIRECVWAFCGDMAAETGTFHECSKYAENFKLPLVFVIEDNGLSTQTPTQTVWGYHDSFIPSLRSNTIYYTYKNSFNHQGAGKEAGF